MQVIDNFLEEFEFREIYNTIVDNIEVPWIYNSVIAKKNEPAHNLCYFAHPIVEKWQWRSPFAHVIFPVLRKLHFELGVNSQFDNIKRIKCNLFPSNTVLSEHEMHADQPVSHTAAILYLNTCDGYTRIGDKIVHSVRNRLLIFDGNVLHCSTNCTDVKARFNININFLKKN